MREPFVRNGLTRFETISRRVTATTNVAAPLRFAESGGDHLCVLLDNISLTAIPEPATGALLAFATSPCGSSCGRWKR